MARTHMAAGDRCRKEQGGIMLNAQTQAMPFYARFGFVPDGEPFEEAGIPHVTMFKRL